MAKQTSLFGKISGKLGAVVFSTSGGETISREYNPHVANPNTDAQINQRARMKLMSQLSACLAPVIAMQKEGLVSVRNKFVKRNFESCYSVNGQAQISYENVQLTQGNAGLPVINYFTSGEQGHNSHSNFICGHIDKKDRFTEFGKSSQDKRFVFLWGIIPPFARNPHTLNLCISQKTIKNEQTTTANQIKRINRLRRKPNKLLGF